MCSIEFKFGLLEDLFSDKILRAYLNQYLNSCKTEFLDLSKSKYKAQ